MKMEFEVDMNETYQMEKYLEPLEDVEYCDLDGNYDEYQSLLNQIETIKGYIEDQIDQRFCPIGETDKHICECPDCKEAIRERIAELKQERRRENFDNE